MRCQRHHDVPRGPVRTFVSCLTRSVAHGSIEADRWDDGTLWGHRRRLSWPRWWSATNGRLRWRLPRRREPRAARARVSSLRRRAFRPRIGTPATPQQPADVKANMMPARPSTHPPAATTGRNPDIPRAFLLRFEVTPSQNAAATHYAEVRADGRGYCRSGTNWVRGGSHALALARLQLAECL